MLTPSLAATISAARKDIRVRPVSTRLMKPDVKEPAASRA
jgi:hypothetical protein